MPDEERAAQDQEMWDLVEGFYAALGAALVWPQENLPIARYYLRKMQEHVAQYPTEVDMNAMEFAEDCMQTLFPGC